MYLAKVSLGKLDGWLDAFGEGIKQKEEKRRKRGGGGGGGGEGGRGMEIERIHLR